MPVVGIVPAGGSGERLGASCPKAFVALAGRPMIEHSLDVLGRCCDRVVVAVPDGYPVGPDSVRGGRSRSASVRNALEAAPEADLFVVHDAARPLVTAEMVRECIATLDRDHDLAGAIAAAPVNDTVKVVDRGERVTRTLERDSLRAVQTPQVFRAPILRSVLAGASDERLARATDDAGLIEDAGGSVAVVAAPRENLKVTTALDLRLAELLIAERGP